VANDALKNAVKMGVKVALGTDWTGWDTSCNVLELKLLVEQLGLSPLEAIKAATSSAAELLDWSDQVGTIEAGKLADVLVVEGNPLEDITCLQKVTAVFVDGQQVPKTPRWF
jgi:imidazolonepropionase-like amidohydrolase